jgi:hypothetical protein
MYRKGELNALLACGEHRAPTSDDVSVTIDGRRLDSPTKVRAWLEELNASRVAASSA